jgi:hypothetical protein
MLMLPQCSRLLTFPTTILCTTVTGQKFSVSPIKKNVPRIAGTLLFVTIVLAGEGSIFSCPCKLHRLARIRARKTR